MIRPPANYQGGKNEHKKSIATIQGLAEGRTELLTNQVKKKLEKE